MKKIFSYLNTVNQIRRDKIVAPRFLTYIVTFKCNARCIMCDSWKKKEHNDLSVEEIENIFKQLPQLDGIRLSGGEPFLRKDLIEIDHLAQKYLKPYMIHITSNGFLTERIIEFVEKREKKIPLYLLISLDGLEATHNRIRGLDNAWGKTTSTLKELVSLKERYKITLDVNQTIVDEEGIEQYFKLRDYLKQYNIKNNFVLGYDVSATYSTDQDIDVAPENEGDFTSFGDFSEESLRRLFKYGREDIKNFSWIDRLAKNYYLQGIENRVYFNEGKPNPKCVALNAHMRLMPDGTVPTCQFNSKTVGDFRKQTFEEIWYGQEIEPMRQWVKECAGCWAECEVLPNSLYTGDIIKKTIFPAKASRNGHHKKR